jgi:translation initiation factor 3 subunit D
LASGQARKRGGFKGIGRTAHAPQYSNTGQQQGGNYNNHYGNNNNNNRFGGGSPDVPKASLVVQDDWTLVDQWTAMAMQKLPGGSAAGEDIELRGQVRPYVKAVERTAAAAPVPVQATTRAFLRVTTTEDPVLQQLAMSGKDQLYATDQVLTHLMTARRSGQSWDIIVTKIAGKIFLDKRDGSPVDLVSVNENDAEPPKAEDGELAPHVLSAEATLVNQKFSQHVVDAKGAPAQLGETPELFEEALEDGAQPVDVAYRYRRFRLNDGTSIVVRCEVDAYQGTPAAPKFATVRALNEYKIGAASDWRHKLDSSKGSVMAAELKSNNAKLVRWTAQALLAGNELLTIGFVSRLRSRTADQHVLLGVQTYGTADFAKQTGSSLNNLWGIVQKVVASLSKKENGKYVLLLVPGTKALALYSVPLNTFEPEDAADEDDAAAAADGDERGIRNAGNVGDVRLAGSDDEDDDGDAK